MGDRFPDLLETQRLLARVVPGEHAHSHAGQKGAANVGAKGIYYRSKTSYYREDITNITGALAPLADISH